MFGKTSSTTPSNSITSSLDIQTPFTLNEKTSFSFDFWAFIGLPNSSSYASIGACGIYGNRGFTNWFYLNNGSAGEALTVYLNGVNTTTDFIVPRGTWTHYYAGYDAKTFTYFAYANGEKVFEKKDETPYSYSLISISAQSSGVRRFDEVRFSDTVRWTEDFEPPTQPYSKEEPTGNMVVNFVGDIQTVKNDLDELGDQVSEIESKIPGTTSATNLLVNKSELESITNTKVTGEGVTSIKVLTQADYAALATKDQNTCYIIVG